MFGRKPDLVTALITRRKDRSFEVQYIGDDSGSPKEPKPATTLAELRAAIDPALVARYGEKLPDNGMGGRLRHLSMARGEGPQAAGE
jgi:hypothetical protein